jgi:hypothetical protein
MVFFIVLFGDFVNGIVEREQDVLAKRHPWRGLRMFLQKIKVGLGVELNALPLGHVVRVRIDPLFAILKKGAAIYEFELLRVVGHPIRFGASRWCTEGKAAQRLGGARID